MYGYMLIHIFVVGLVMCVLVSGYFWNTAHFSLAFWKDSHVPCTETLHKNDLDFIFSIQIVTDEVPDLIPAHIGSSSDCVAHIHTKDASGTVYVDGSADARTYRLKDFFDVWDVSSQKEGYDMTVYVDDSLSDLGVEVPLRAGEHIVVVYTKQL